MKSNNSNDDLPWMNEEMKNHMEYLDRIVKNQDVEALFSLNDNADFSICLYEILNNRCDYNPKKLNPKEKTLLLCMYIENAGQADHILSFLQENYPEYSIDVINALKEIGAIKSSNIIQQAVNLLPNDGTWFFDYADENSQDLMDQLDSKFSDYPDGILRNLYRQYAEKYRNEF